MESPKVSIVSRTTLSNPLAHTNSQQVSQERAPYILSPSWLAFVFSHVRALLWNDRLVSRGYNQVSVGCSVT
jgi:hypothetical protein